MVLFNLNTSRIKKYILVFSLVLMGGNLMYGLPSPNAGVTQYMRAADTNTLDGSGSTGTGTLHYQWIQLTGPTHVIISDPKTVSPTITGLVFGEYKFRLVVTDDTGTASADVTHGSVATDSNGVVIYPDSRLYTLLGPQVRSGTNPWPWVLDRQLAFADYLGGLQGTTYTTPWNDNFPSNQTVSVTKGTSTVTGVNTHFQAEFCNGGTTPATGNNAPSIVFNYHISQMAPGETGKFYKGVAGCPSDTQLTIGTENSIPSQSNITYAKMITTDIARFGSQAFNIQYYDNVMAFWKLYYSTGLSKYKTYALWLSEAWETYPQVDHGYYLYDSDGYRILPARSWAITGLLIKAIEYDVSNNAIPGSSPTWGTVRRMWDYAQSLTFFAPEREYGYKLGYQAQAAMFDPDSSRRNTYFSVLQTALTTKWFPAQVTSGTQTGAFQTSFIGQGNSNRDYQNAGGTVCVSNGDTVVTFSGTTIQSSWFPSVLPNGFHFYSRVSSGVDTDTVDYAASYIDGTHIAITPAYQGTGGCGRQWQMYAFTKNGTQPYMMGIVATGMYWAHLACLMHGDTTNAALAKSSLFSLTDWVMNYGYSPTWGGQFYARGYLSCEPDPYTGQTSFMCQTGDGNIASPTYDQTRALNGESVNAMVASILAGGAPNEAAYLAHANLLSGRTWGKPGFDGPDSDGHYVSSWNSPLSSSTSYKWWGFFGGYGNLVNVEGLNKGGVTPADVKVYSMTLGLANVARAASVKVYLTAANKNTSSYICNSDPCTINADVTQNGGSLYYEYYSGSGATGIKLATSGEQPYMVN